MKYAVIAIVIAACAGSASAAERFTDVDYLRANRCKGLATAIQGVMDPAAFATVIKAERGARAAYIVDRGDDEFDKARREAKFEDRRERLTAELTNSCQAFLGGPTSVASKPSGVSAQ